MNTSVRTLFLTALVAALPLTIGAQSGPSPRVRAAIQGIESMLTSAADAPLLAFAEQTLAESYRASFAGDSLLRHLRAIRSAVGEIGGVQVRRDSIYFYLELEGQRSTTVRFALDEPGRVTSLELLAHTERREPESAWSGLSWETLESVVQHAAAAGFSGTLLARRNGVETLRTAVGLADPVAGTRTAMNTVYGIGSQPMDFTKTAVLLLAQRGRLSLDDTIGRFIRDVPADKRAITVRHLLSSGSGLLDFYHDSTDWDADLSWITREEAVRRMMASPLRFAPGTARLPSHAAYNLLAVIIEEASGQSYPDFLRVELLQPLGMNRTGFYGETLGLTLDQFAVGGGPSVVGLPNVPPNWGPTSWLVMGSGGMVSTIEDMDRYYTALTRGTLLTGEWARMQPARTTGAGGSIRGYFIFHVNDGDGSSVLLLTNSNDRVRNTRAMTGALERLVLGPR